MTETRVLFRKLAKRSSMLPLSFISLDNDSFQPPDIQFSLRLHLLEWSFASQKTTQPHTSLYSFHRDHEKSPLSQRLAVLKQCLFRPHGILWVGNPYAHLFPSQSFSRMFLIPLYHGSLYPLPKVSWNTFLKTGISVQEKRGDILPPSCLGPGSQPCDWMHTLLVQSFLPFLLPNLCSLCSHRKPRLYSKSVILICTIRQSPSFESIACGSLLCFSSTISS